MDSLCCLVLSVADVLIVIALLVWLGDGGVE